MARSPQHLARPAVVGWREFVGLPDLGVPNLKAKVDTGARTSALHAVDLEPVDRADGRWIAFRVTSASRRGRSRSEARLIDERPIKNTSGVPETRYVIETTLVLGRRHWLIEVSLANRQEMEFDLILGRTAIRRHGLLVNPARSFLAGEPSAVARRKKPSPVR